MKQFGRQLKLEISSNSETLTITQLRVSFEIDKTINEKPNPAKIDIWNLNRDHINQLLNQEFKRVVLSAGYAELRVIYSGDITKARVSRQGMDFVMSLECADGFKDFTQARTATTLKSGATDEQLVEEIQKSLSHTEAGAINFENKRKLPRGRVLNGNSRDLLNRIAKNHEADWSIQDGALIFLPKNKVLNEDAVVLSQESGMVGMPEHTDDGLEVQCLLNPALQVGGVVKIDSIINHFDGEYKIVSLQHSGDNLEGDWLSKLTVVGGKFQKVEKPVKEKKGKGKKGKGKKGKKDKDKTKDKEKNKAK